MTDQLMYKKNLLPYLEGYKKAEWSLCGWRLCISINIKHKKGISFSFFSARAGDEPTGVGILATADVGPVRAYERTGGALIHLGGRAHGKDDIQGRPCSAHATASPRPGKKLYPFKSLIF